MDFYFIESKAFKIAIGISVIFILFQVIFFPCFGDISVFYSGGVRILEGGKIYVDWVDIKPPLIYYYFAAAIAIFGKGECGIRIFDFFYQLLTVYSLYFLVNKKIRNITTAYFTCLTYSIIYVSTNHSYTMQAETIAALPFIWSIYYFTKDKLKYKNILISGIFFGLASGLKYTLAFAFLGYLTDIFFAERNKEYRSSQKINFTLFYILSGIIGLAIASFPLLDYATRQGFIEMLGFLKLYTKSSIDLMSIIKLSVQTFGYYFGDTLSIIFSAFSFLGLINTFNIKNDNDFPKFLFFTFIGLLISVNLESKFLVYHYNRLIFIYSIFAALGISHILNILKYSNFKNKYNIIILLTSTCLLIFYSPISRIIKIVKVNSIKVKSQYQYDSMFTLKTVLGPKSLILQAKEVAEYINLHSSPSKTYMLANSADGPFIEQYIKISDKNNKFAQSYFCNLTYNYLPYYYKFIYLINKTNWLILANNDTEPGFTLKNISSFNQFMSNSVCKKSLYDNYKEVYHTENLYLYMNITNR